MKAPTKNYLRGMRHQVGSLIGLVIIIAVAVAFYTTLKTVVINYETSTNTYFADYTFPDAIISGANFTESDATMARDVDGVGAVQLRAIVDVENGDDTLRIFSYDTQDPEVNTPYIYEGTAPQSANECLVTQKYATKNNLQIGATLKLENTHFSDECTVVGLATSPEHMYLRQNDMQPVANTQAFGVVYVDTEFATRNQLPFGELVFRYANGADVSTTTEKVEATLPVQKLLGTTEHDDIFSYQAHRADLEQFEIFAYLFPIVFFVIAGIVIFVSQRRAVIRDRTQIGALKAMGYGNWQVTQLYLLGTIVTAALGLLAGFGLSLILGPWVVGAFDAMLSAPFLSFGNAWQNLLVPAIVAVIICVVPTLLAVHQVIRLNPATAMRPAPPAAGRDIWVQKTPLWKHLSFNTRYGLKAALRNRGRFAAMVCGIVAMLALVTLSLGFRDSFNFVTTSYYDDIANYDISVQTAPTPVGTVPEFSTTVSAITNEQVFALPATVQFDGQSKDLPTYISADPLKTHTFVSTNGGAISYADGVVLPRVFAQNLGVKRGDIVKISTASQLLDGEVEVVDISDQDLGFGIIMTYETARDALGFSAPLYNVVYAQVDGDAQQAAQTLSDDSHVVSVTTLADDRASYQQISAMFNTFIFLLVLFSIVLGVATLYAISSITLLSRQYEFVVLRVMGYDRGDILLAYIKELLLQCALAIPLGLWIGYLLVGQLVTAFQLDTLSFSRHITPATYVYSAGIALAVLGLMVLVARRQLGRQNLVEGLKSRGD